MASWRLSDPVTSLLAAKSVSEETISIAKKRILEMLRAKPQTDEELFNRYSEFVHSFGDSLMSPSGLRSRRSELERAGLVRAVGFSKTRSGRKCIVWGLAE